MTDTKLASQVGSRTNGSGVFMDRDDWWLNGSHEIMLVIEPIYNLGAPLSSFSFADGDLHCCKV